MTEDRGVSVVICAAVNTTGTEAAASACPSAGVFTSMLATEVLPVVCRADVEAPAGSGRETADTGWVTAEPSTFHAEAPPVPWFAVTVPDTGWVTGKFVTVTLGPVAVEVPEKG